MKFTKNLFTEPSRWAILGASFLLVFTVSCDHLMLLDMENKRTSSLDYSEIEPGSFIGEYGGGEWEISLPPAEVWNAMPHRYLMFYAHGIVDPVPYEAVQLPDDMIGESPVQELLNSQGIGYASTSYRDNGLVVLEAVEDIKQLVELARLFFKINTEYTAPDFLFLGGPSEGGLVTVKTIEKYGHLFDGAISICAPIGNFYDQLQYNGDFHVLFNYFFGQDLLDQGIDIGNPRDGVQPAIMEAWKSGALQAAIIQLMQAHFERVPQLLITAKATVDMEDPEAMGTAVLELLRFNIMFTNDVNESMDGVPYNNSFTKYIGSLDDERLNREVQRIDESNFPKVKSRIRKYETMGKLINVPLVTIHTDGDYIIPFWHETLYGSKIFPEKNRILHKSIPVVNYGHCTISEANIQEALAFLIGHVTSSNYIQLAEKEF